MTSAVGLSAQIPDSVFKPAYQWSKLVSFDPPSPLDLAAIALAARPDFRPARPDSSLLRKFYDEFGGSASIPYEAALPTSLPIRHYWVLGDSGASEVRPQKIAGTIYVETDSAGWIMREVRYFGSVVARPARTKGIGYPNFAFFSPQPLHIRSAPARIAETYPLPIVRVSLDSRQIEVTLDSIPIIRGRNDSPIRAWAFEIGETGQLLLSVGWPDDDLCAGEYVLYDLTGGKARPVTRRFGPCVE